MTCRGSVPSLNSAIKSRVSASMTNHLPQLVAKTTTEPSGEKQADWIGWPTCLSQISVRLIVSISRTWPSQPADRNWDWLGWQQRPNTSSVWPTINGVKAESKVPFKMQLRVVPTNKWLPLPWTTVLTWPYWTGTFRQFPKENFNW